MAQQICPQPLTTQQGMTTNNINICIECKISVEVAAPALACAGRHYVKFNFEVTIILFLFL